jgi:hypothetical protein
VRTTSIRSAIVRPTSTSGRSTAIGGPAMLHFGADQPQTWLVVRLPVPQDQN